MKADDTEIQKDVRIAFDRAHDPVVIAAYIRGRVGRGGVRAYAHLLTESKSEQSEKRLAVLEEFSKPGAGFAISERDLDLRGAGDLNSERQSGHVQVFGPVLYSHLLKLASDRHRKHRLRRAIKDRMQKACGED